MCSIEINRIKNYTKRTRIFIVVEIMSRTFARLELSVTQNGNKMKTFTENVSTDEKDVQTLLNALQKTKDSSNAFLTTLVEEERISKSGGVVISHSKRKHFDEGNCNATK